MNDYNLLIFFLGFEELPEQPKRKIVVVEQNDIDIQPVDPFGLMNTESNNVTFSDNMKERGQNMSMLHIECDSVTIKIKKLSAALEYIWMFLNDYIKYF